MYKTINNKLLTLVVYSFLLSISLKGQITEVSTTILSDSFEGFEFLESELADVKILGIGESTHGTKEFKVLQCNVFKYLVKHQGYTTFFLEDEYLYCLPIDEYIKGGEGNIDTLVAGLRNWPWRTPQLKMLIAWMKSYNETHNNVLSFIGVDFQDQQAFKHHLKKVFNIETKGKDFVEIVESIDTPAGKRKIDLFKQSLIELANGEKRDAAMAHLILKYLELNEDAKGVFCAHNMHLLKVIINKKNAKKDRMWAGGLLDAKLKEGYYALVTDFDYGEFWAYTLKADARSKGKYANHEFKVNKAVCQDSKFSLCKYLKDQNGEIIFVSDLHNNPATKKRININAIGAAYYGKKEDATMHKHIDYVSPKFVDGILFFKSTNAANIIK